MPHILICSPENAMYFMMFSILVHKIFTFYLMGELKFKCSALGPKCYLLESTCTGESFIKELQTFCMFLYVFFMSLNQVLIFAAASP